MPGPCPEQLIGTRDPKLNGAQRSYIFKVGETSTKHRYLKINGWNITMGVLEDTVPFKMGDL